MSTSKTKRELAKQAYAGQSVYGKFMLTIYDWYVIKFSNSLIWKCPSQNIQNLFNKHISNNHLDVGVGTGYFLHHSIIKSNARIALMDMNCNSLKKAAQRIKRYSPEVYQQNILEPINTLITPFDSISINFLLHCLPGKMLEKLIAIDHLYPLLNSKGKIFGSTILQGSAPRSKSAQKLMNKYNEKGFFSNQNDTIEDLESYLNNKFQSFEIQQIGCVSLFCAYKE